MKRKNLILSNAEHIYFLVESAGWLVTKIFVHYTEKT